MVRSPSSSHSANSFPPSQPSSAPFPNQRWQVATPTPDLAAELAIASGISPLFAQVLINRQLTSAAQVQAFLHPDSLVLPDYGDEFEPLAKSIDLLTSAIQQRHRIAICGDYDADGMTSTALLIRALRSLGAIVDYAIPSRMSEGYGINRRIVEEFHDEGVRLLLTVDNGIAAHDPVQRARELGIEVIITDHHDLPPTLPNASAILNPKMLSPTSPYRGLAGVGVAFILARSLADSMGNAADLGSALLELFTLGTIADLAPLTGVNRCWVKQGLKALPTSKLAGVKALIQVSGLENERNLKPEAIGFRLGPRINAVGRIADPQVVIELLTTDDPGIALERAMQCEQINQQRQQLCEQIEQEAIAVCEAEHDPVGDRVLLLTYPGWHHGVIGIVASRLVERYGVPVFISTYEDEAQHHIRGSARGIPEFNVFDALEYCQDLLEKHGGHKAAGGFSLRSENLSALRSRLRDFCHQCLQPNYLKPLVRVDVNAPLCTINEALYTELDGLQPCGIENSEAILWSEQVHIHDQKVFGKGHLKLSVSQTSAAGVSRRFEAIAWRWRDYYPLPSPLDIAYRLRRSEWQGEVSLELELVGVRQHRVVTPLPKVEFMHGDRCYACRLAETEQGKQLRIRNDQGNVLTVYQGDRLGKITKESNQVIEVDVSQPYYFNLIRAAISALNQENSV